MLDTTTKDIKYNFSKIFWIFFGALLAIPIDLAEGLFFAYFQIIFLFLITKKLSELKLILVLFYVSIVLVSTFYGSDQRLVSLINPTMLALVFLIEFKDSEKINLIFKGMYFSLTLLSIYMIYLFSKIGFTSYYALLNSREWASDDVSFFGNGLAILISFLFVKATKESKYIYALLFFVVGVLTTSRIPIYTAFFILIFYLIKSLGSFTNIMRFILLTTLILIFASYTGLIEELSSLSERILGTSDRVDVYTLAFNTFLDNPFLGIGAERLPYFLHAHNSYLQVLVKYGIFAFIIWLTLIYFVFFTGYKYFSNLDFIFTFFIISMAQIGLHHPNAILIILLYVSYLQSSKKINV